MPINPVATNTDPDPLRQPSTAVTSTGNKLPTSVTVSLSTAANDAKPAASVTSINTALGQISTVLQAILNRLNGLG